MSYESVINIIRNINNLCPYNCGICLVNAKYVKLENSTTNNPQYWVDKWYEISLEDKIKIIHHLDYVNLTIDVSGWEPLLFPEWLEVLSVLSKKFWRENITVTTTWFSNIDFNTRNQILLERCVWNIDFTYDWVEDLPYRPSGYSQNNLSFISKFSKSVKNNAQVVLTTKNISLRNIEKTILELKKYNIDTISLIKFHPIGRWSNYNDLVVDIESAKKVIDAYLFFSEKHEGPKVKYQKTLLGWKIGATRGCSLFINEKWDLFSNSWKKDKFWKDDSNYKIWNLVDNSFTQLCWVEYNDIKNLQKTHNKI